MYAGIVSSFDRPPRLETVAAPVAPDEHEVVVDVLAAGLHPRVRSSADGSHYSSDGVLPLIPGIDGVGRTADGELLFFVLPDTRQGSFAEQTVVDRRRAVVLPADSDVNAVAAGMNPGMSSWIALRRRIALQPGATVMVLGAHGNAGRMATEVARHLGAGEVIGVGREGVGDRVDVDVVLDYLWGEPALEAMRALVTRRSDAAAPLDWIQIGAVAGPDLALPSAALRAANLRIVGSGQGSVDTADIVAELPSLAVELTAGTFAVDPVPVPLADVEEAWTRRISGRVVFVP